MGRRSGRGRGTAGFENNIRALGVYLALEPSQVTEEFSPRFLIGNILCGIWLRSNTIPSATTEPPVEGNFFDEDIVKVYGGPSRVPNPGLRVFASRR